MTIAVAADSGDSFDEILARFLAELERSDDRPGLIRAYEARHPKYAPHFREYASLPGLLDATIAGADADEQRPTRLGDFRIDREISHGGMKTVYLAEQEPLQRRVAVATIRRGRIQSAHRDRFLREQRVLAQLHQTNIVPIFAAGEAGSIQYFAMPYIEGAALHHIIQHASRSETRGAGSSTPSLKELAQRVLEVEKESPATCDLPAGPAAAEPATATEPAAAPPPVLSPEYFRSVARVMADVAESLQHAHDHGFLHRDIKPANIMVDTDERCWLIDFGLAGFLERPDAPAQAGRNRVEEPAGLTSTRGVLGTPGYMAPEQEAGEPSDARTDVWGLGATLYELLTLRRAFPAQLREETAAAPARQSPPAPRRVVGNVPPDLAAICMKALRSEPDGRYPTAGEVADDLRRWLRGEPTTARPARAPRRAYLWAKRNKGWASAITVSLVALVGLAVGAFLVAQQRKRENVMLQVERLLVPGQVSGWSDRAWELERLAVGLRKDDRVRDQAVSILGGLDAKLCASIPEFGAQSMLFEPKGERLLMSTLVATDKWPAAAKLWHVKSGELQELRGAGFGPVAFASDGTPLQLTVRHEQNELTLVDLSRGEVTSRFAMPSAAGLQFSDELAIAADGSSVAAAVLKPDGEPAGILLWSGAARDWLPLLPFGAVPALAFSPDGTLLATGDEDGEISIWSVRTGQSLASLRSSRNGIRSLAFGRDRRRPASSDDAETNGWLLAAGDEGSMVAIWDLTRKVPRSYCRGSSWDVEAVAFSPDGVTLASAGHSETWLWDVATGRPLLSLEGASDGTRSLAFSPDGRRLASGGTPAPTRNVVAWELSAARGITGLRGLACPISKTCFSRDGRYVAALAHNWEAAIWDLHTGFLLHVLEVPRGIFADNAALAFSPDGRRFAFSAGCEAKLWDVASGHELQRWELNEGFVDQLAYAGPDRLLSLRVETQDGRLGPYSNAHPSQHPRVCRLRELPEQGRPQVIQEITEFNWRVLSAAASPTGQYFVIEGLGGSKGQLRRLLKVFDAAGQEVATLPSTREVECQTAMHFWDPIGHVLGAMTGKESEGEMTLFEMPSCRVVDKIGPPPRSLSPGGTYLGIPWRPGVTGLGLSLFRRGEREPLVVFDENQRTWEPQFDTTGTQLAWARTDGTLVVADLPEVHRRLAELGLGW